MTTSSRLLPWSPRVLGIVVCAFLAMFSLDAFGNGKPVVQAIPDFATRIAPVLTLLAVVGVAWRWEWAPLSCSPASRREYAYVSRDHVSRVVTIAGPLLIVGILFFWNCRNRRELQTHR